MVAYTYSKMPVFRIRHITRYDYDSPIKEGLSQIRLFPVSSEFQKIHEEVIIISSNPTVSFYIDYFNNRVGEFSIMEPHNQLLIDSRIVVETTPSTILIEPFDPKDLPQAISRSVLLIQYARPEVIKEQWMIDHILEEVAAFRQNLHQMVWACSEFIYKNFRYEKGITTVDSHLDEILHHRSGVCQDFVHVCLQLLRTQGIPARYVSGYICPNKSGLRGEGATHAWLEYYHPNHGWIGIDPTNNVWVQENHVTLAVGRVFADCTPVKGTFKGIARQTLSIHVSVGYEDGHTYEDVNKVNMVSEPEKEHTLEGWQKDWLQAQQQQQQQQ